MPTYQYQAFEKSGKSVKGVVLAETPERARTKVRDKGIYVSRLKEVRVRHSKRGQLRQKLILFRELSSLLAGGKTLDQSLDLIWEIVSEASLKPIIADLKERVRVGQSLAQAFEASPALFTPFDMALIRTGEESGSLAQTLRLLAEYLEKEESLRTQIRTALAYPLFVALFSFATVLALFTFVIPTLKELYADVGGTLPILTQALLGISFFLKNYGVGVLGLALVGLFFLRRPNIKASLKKIMDEKIFSLPRIGDWVGLREGGRFCTTLATLLNGGMQLVPAMDIAGQVFKNCQFRQMAGEIKEAIIKGASLGASLKKYPFVPAIIPSLIRAGEESGNLKEQLTYLGEMLEEESSQELKYWMSFLEPVLIIAVGLVIGLVVLAVILPIVSLNQIIS